MSLKTQAKVLRVLQEGEVERLGSARTLKVDVRVIAATNKNLEEEIEKGRFREDLFFRLSVIPIFVPPLRERADDIPAAGAATSPSCSRRENNFRPKRFTPDALAALQRGAVEGQRPGAAEHHRARHHHDARRRRRRRRSAGVGPGGGAGGGRCAEDRGERPGTLREFKESAERAFLVEKLRENGWNISKTAEVIGTPRSNLYKKLEQYNIRQDDGVLGGDGSAAVSQTTAVSGPGPQGPSAGKGGKSELRRAVRRVTPGQGDLKESGTENIPPAFALRASAGQARKGVPRRSSPEPKGPASGEGKGEKVR